MRTIFLFIISLCPLWAAQAQNKPDPLSRAQQYIDNAQKFYAAADYKASIKEYQFAADLYRRQSLADKYALCYNGIGNNYIDLSQFDAALGEFKRVLVHYSEQKRADSSYVVDSLRVADAYEGLGRYYMNKDVNFDSAIAWHSRALDIRMRSKGEKSPEVALSYYFIGRCYRGLESDSSRFVNGKSPAEVELEYLQKGLDIQLDLLGEKHYQTANSYEALSDYYCDIKNDQPKGNEYQQKALSIREALFGSSHPATAGSYLQLAKYFKLVGDYDKELLYLEKALQIAQTVFTEQHQTTAHALALLANHHLRSGDLERAKAFFERALKIYGSTLGEQSPQAAEVYLGLARCAHLLERYDDENIYLQKSLAIAQKIYGQQHYKVANVWVEIGNLYLYKNRPDSALAYYQNAANCYQKQLGNNHLLTANAYDCLAKVYAYKEEAEKEFFYLNESLQKKKNLQTAPKSSAYSQEVADELGNGFESEVKNASNSLFQSYLNLAYFYQKKRDYKLALSFCQSALASVCPSLQKNSAELRNNPSLSELSRDVEFLPAMQLKSKLSFQLSQQNKDKKELDFAARCYELSLGLIDTLRINFTSDAAKEQLIKRSISVYEGAIEAYFALYIGQQDPQFLQKLFTTVEKSKAFVLMQAIQNNKAKGAGIIPADLLAKEERLRHNLAYYTDFKNRPDKNAAEFDQAYFDTKQEYDQLIKQLEKDYPSYFQLKYSHQPLQISDIQARLIDNKTAILEYFVGDSNLYVFYIDKLKAQMYKQPLAFKQTSSINLLRANLTDYVGIQNDPKRAYDDFCRLAFEVYGYFFEPFIQQKSPEVEKLVVIPDGILNYLPFEALIAQKAASNGQISYRDLDFLIRKYEINYAYSVSLYDHNIKQARLISHNGQCLAYAPTYDQSSSNANLPGTAEELKAIQKVYKGNFIFGAEATKAHFLKNAASYGIVHLAMHGIVNFRNPSKSYLAFASVKGDSLGLESSLYNYEIQNANLNSALVVLSACETGYGRVIRGEGVLSLARNFMAAGTPSVVTTLWQVNDQTSSVLMSLFYQNIGNGFGKAAALRHAKLAFLDKTNQISGHPAFWASFITVGDPSPVHLGWAWWWWAVIIAAIAAPFVIALWILKRRKQQNEAAEQAVQTLKEKLEAEAATNQELQATNELIFDTLRKKIRRNISD